METADNGHAFGLWELTVLSFLRERPMHPYEIRRLLKKRHKDSILVLKHGSLYHAIQRLERASLIEAVETIRDGARPERTTYRILPAGESALLESLFRFIAVPLTERSHFMGSISFLFHLRSEDAVAALRRRVEVLEKEIAELDRVVADTSPRIGRIHLIESEYAQAMRAAELSWVQGILEELESGSLYWDLDAILRGSDTAPSTPEPVRQQ